MDSNTPEKKPKRPRIGQAFRATEEGIERSRYDRPYNPTPRNEGDSAENTTGNDGYRSQRPYQPRQGGYQQRQGGYNNNNHYNNNRPYQPRRYDNNNGEGGEQGENRQGGYQPRQYGNNQGGYQQRQPRQYGNNQGGYQQRQPRQYGNGNNQRPNSYGNNQGGQRPYNNNNRNGQRPNSYGNNQGGQRPYNNNNNRNGQRPYNNNRNRQDNNGFPGRGKSFTPRPKRIEYEVPVPDPNEQIRLNKYMSNAGICSRREADEYIQQGLVKVNGQVVTELGTKITHNDVVEYDEKVVTPESKCYILLNKPKDCVTTSDDPNGRMTVMDLVKGACNERIYPVGRLDRNTTGVLLLTNDGDLASKLTHPKFVKKKIYHVWCDRDISEDDMQRIADGIELEDGPIHADAISYATETDRNQAGIEIHSGRNRIVRRIFESLGYRVTKLDRVYFAGLTKKNLPRGRWRYLTQEEVNYLKMGSFE